jgi:2-oxoglutarate dehydrogenase E2 component (dihydrolipoamide succinyltransferase)
VDLVTMPQLGETVTEGTIVKWFKQVGDEVAVDDVLFEVSTDKVDTEVPSAHAGFLRVVHVPEGETVPIGTPLAVLTATADEALAEQTPPTPVVAVPTPTAEASPIPARSASRTPATRVEHAHRAETPPTGFLSPAVRTLLAEQGLRADQVIGSGRDGRITRNDVLAAAARSAAAGPATAPSAVAATAQVVARPGVVIGADVEPAGDDEVVELSNMRRVTAEHMVRSLATSAHTLVAMEVDYSAVDTARRGTKLGYLPFIARAVIDAIGRFPHVNAVFGRDRLIVHQHVHLGIAVDLDFQGLVVPVVKDAGTLRLPALATAIADVAAKARSKRLTADAFAGGTFTITNAGGYGTLLTVPVINQPQVAILGTDGVKMRPVAVRGGPGGDEWLVAVRPIGNLALSFDHRAFDGAYASAFLALVRELLETREWASEL